MAFVDVFFIPKTFSSFPFEVMKEILDPKISIVLHTFADSSPLLTHFGSFFSAGTVY